MASNNKKHPDTRDNGHTHFDIPIVEGVPSDILPESSSRPFIGDYVTNQLSEDDSNFIFRIDDNVFADRGIRQGDFVVAASEARLNSGDLVIATLGEETFMAAFFPLGHKFRLERDSRGKNILVLDPAISQFSLQGKVVQIIRPIE